MNHAVNHSHIKVLDAAGNPIAVNHFPADLSSFYAITPVINSPRYKARAQNYWKFAEVCAQAGIKLVTVEVAFGERPYEVTQAGNPFHLQLRTEDEYWHKEVAINSAIDYVLARLDPSAKYIGWFDSDQWPISISPRQWFEEIFHQLQHYEIVQCWEYLINFGPDSQPITAPQMSFMKTYFAAGFQIPKGANVPHTLAGNSGMVSLGRPGLAWAANAGILKKLRLLDICILGSGDWHMAHAFVGGITEQGGYSWETDKLSVYCKALLEYQAKCEEWLKRDVGFVPVTVGHWYHGSKADRRYNSRGRILIENGYDPYVDIKRDHQGLWVLESRTPRQLALRDQIRGYLHTRNEDSIPER